MLCEKCKKNPATIHFTQIQDGKVTSYNLCKECAEKHGLKSIKFESEQQPVFAPEGKEQVLNDLVDEPSAKESVECEFCHSSLNDLKRTGRMGCARCYYAFEKQLDALLRRIQGSSFHVGSRYGQLASARYDDQLKIRELKKKLNEAVKEEDFEKAAALRDEIRTMEKRLEISK